MDEEKIISTSMTISVVLPVLYRTVLSRNIWLWLKLEKEPKLWTKVEPEPKINNFGSATLIFFAKADV